MMMREFRFDHGPRSIFIKKQTKSQAITEFENTHPGLEQGIDYTVTEISAPIKKRTEEYKNEWRNDGNLNSGRLDNDGFFRKY